MATKKQEVDQIQLMRGTEAEIQARGLLDGEPALATDTGRLHYGYNGEIHVTPTQAEMNTAAGQAKAAETNATAAKATAEAVKLDSAAAITAANEAKSAAASAVSTAGTAKTTADSAVATADAAKTTADAAKTNADTAKSDAATAKTDAASAKATSDASAAGLQEARTNASNAVTTAGAAKTTADAAKTTADAAKATADKVRADFDEIMSGNTDAEVVNARTNASGITFTNVKSRLDDSDSKLNQATTNISDLQQTLANADKNAVGLGNVDNTSDLDKPISTATQTVLDSKATVESVTELENEIGILSTTVTNHIEDYVSHYGYAVTTSDEEHNYMITLNPAPTSYVDGMGIRIKLDVDNPDDSEINVNDLGWKKIYTSNGEPAKNLKANGIYTIVYNATTGNFILQGERSGGGEGGEYGTAIASDVRMGKSIGTANGIVNGTLDLNNLIPSNIKKDVVIAGVVGSYVDINTNTSSVTTIYGLTIYNGAASCIQGGSSTNVYVGLRFESEIKSDRDKGYMLSIEAGGLVYDLGGATPIDYNGVYIENSKSSDGAITMQKSTVARVSTTMYRTEVKLVFPETMSFDLFTIDISKFKLIVYKV